MKRSPQLEVPSVKLCRDRRVPLPGQIHRALRQAIADGVLQPGSRLPASRVLARNLKVSRNSVLAAYEALCNEGLITGRTGSGTRVASNAATILQLMAVRPNELPRLRESGYPVNPSPLTDPDGNPIFIHG